ncbi:unnamed protein product [Urochloa humidicola]
MSIFSGRLQEISHPDYTSTGNPPPLSPRLEMDAATPSKKAKTSEADTTSQKSWKTARNLTDQILMQEKLTSQRVTAAAAATEQIWTPEKPVERPRACSRSVAFSVKEGRRAALGLRLPKKETPAAAAAADEEADELESAERDLAHPTHLGVGSKERATTAGKSKSPACTVRHLAGARWLRLRSSSPLTLLHLGQRGGAGGQRKSRTATIVLQREGAAIDKFLAHPPSCPHPLQHLSDLHQQRPRHG